MTLSTIIIYFPPFLIYYSYYYFSFSFSSLFFYILIYLIRPHVAEAAFFAVLAAQNITVQFGQRVASVTKSGTTATSLTTEAGLVVSASIFIDASYEGDLLPLLGVDYAWGREGVADYNETLAGRLKEPSSVGGHQFTVKVDPFWSNGRYTFIFIILIIPFINIVSVSSI